MKDKKLIENIEFPVNQRFNQFITWLIFNKKIKNRIEFEAKTGFSKNSVYSYTRSLEPRPLRVWHILNTHKVFNVNVNWLLTGDGSMLMSGEEPSPTKPYKNVSFELESMAKVQEENARYLAAKDEVLVKTERQLEQANQTVNMLLEQTQYLNKRIEFLEKEKTSIMLNRSHTQDDIEGK